jgi:CheY-like chemotaxis protein
MPNLLTSPWDYSSQPLILVVEDSDEDFYTLLRTIEQLKAEMSSSYSFLRLADGDEAIDYLFRQGDYTDLETPRPIAMLLDLNLPGTDGREVIQEVKQHDRLRSLPIIVFTTSRNTVDIEYCYRHGANSYLLKPTGSEKIKNTVRLLFKYWFDLAILPSHT